MSKMTAAEVQDSDSAITHLTLWEEVRYRFFSLKISTSSLMAGAVFSWTSAVVPKFYNNETGFNLTNSELSWVVAISSLGYIIGSLFSRTTSDRYGRRATLLGSVLPIGVNMIIMLFARDAWTIFISRVLWGFGGGMIGSVASIYLAEISDKELRGGLILANRSVYSLGCLLMMSIGPFVSYQTINYSMLVLPISMFATCWWIPETPYFLLKTGRVDEARDILMKLTNTKDEEVLENKLSQMRSDVVREMARSATYKEFFTGKQYRKAIIIVVGVKVTQLLSGLHAIQHYLGPIIQESHYRLSPATALISFGVVRFVLGIISSLLVDRWGRRPMLIYTYFGTGICFTIIGGYFFSAHSSSENPYGFIPFAGIILGMIIAMLGFESVSYSIPAEMFPLNIKSVAMTCTNIFGGFLNFLSVKSYQQIKDLGGLSLVFGVFAAITLAGGVFSLIVVPETKCKSLKQIQIELQGKFYDYGTEKMQPALSTNDKSEDVGEETELNVMERKNKV